MGPRISIFMQLIEAQLRLKLNNGHPVTVAELRGLADLMRYFATTSEDMENRLSGRSSPLCGGENVVAMSDFAGRSPKSDPPGDLT